MTAHHEVTIMPPRTPDDEGNGVQAILRVFMRNPVAAVEVFMFIGGLYATYYALTAKVESVQASSEQHYKDLSSDMVRSNEKMLAKLDVLAAADHSEVDDIKALYLRGDQRYKEMYNKLSEHDVQFSKMSTSVEYIVRQLDEGRAFVPRDKRGDSAPRPANTFGQR